jgi:PAS domain S-box-containing protein
MKRPPETIGEDRRRAHLAAIVDSSDDAILSKDLNGIITSWNPGAERLYGYTAEEAIGEPVSMLVPADHAGESTEIMDRVRRGERVDHYETVRRKKDGRRVHISLTVSPVRDARGRLTGFSAVARDISGRVRAEVALRERDEQRRLHGEQLQTLMSRAPIGMYFIDADFRVRQVNPVAEPIFAGFPGGAIGFDFEEILHHLWDRARADEIVRIFRHTLDTGEPYHVPEFAERRADLGVTEYYDWRIERIVLPDGRYGVVCYFQDISDQVNARLAIARSKERYRTLFASMAEGFCVLDMIFDDRGEPTDYRFVETNPAFERHTGLVGAEGKRVLELVPGIERHWIEIYGRVARTGEPARFVEHSEAVGRWFELDAFRVGAPEEHRVGVLFTDITARKRSEDGLRESEERLRLAKAAAGIGIHDFNPPTGVIGWDQLTREIWGIGEEEPVTYEVWLGGIHPEDREAAEAAVQRALEPDGSGVYFAEYRVTSRSDGITRWVQVTGQTTFSGGVPVRLVGTVQDVTARRRAEEALMEADRRKSAFLATLSHELRSPLAAIRTSASLLGRIGDKPGIANKMTAIIDRQTSHLVRLIDDLLDMSRISMGKIHLDKGPVDLVALVSHCVADVAATRDDDDVELTTAMPEGPIVVDADPVRLAQVVHNLLNNALKFTPRGGAIRVKVAREGDTAKLHVADTGVGMTRDELQAVFEMFAQAAPSQRERSGGLGIGLALAKSITELHGGTIEATSDGPGRGSEFEVRLRASKSAAPGAERPAPDGDAEVGTAANPERQGPRLRIVAAEDHGDALESLALSLRARGHEVATAVDGA